MPIRLARAVLRAAAPALVLAAPGPSLAAPAALTFDIPAEPLDQALLAYAAQSRRQLLFDREITRGLTSPPLREGLAPDAALERLLAGTGIAASTNRQGVVLLKRAARPGPRRRRRPRAERRLTRAPRSRRTPWGRSPSPEP